MAFDYLDFEYSEDEDGNGTWDALASVSPARWPQLLAEITTLLQWAQQRFRGERGPLDEGGDWDLDLQAQLDDSGAEHSLVWDGRQLQTLVPASATTVSLTLSGTPFFGDSLRSAFDLE